MHVDNDTITQSIGMCVKVPLPHPKKNSSPFLTSVWKSRSCLCVSATTVYHKLSFLASLIIIHSSISSRMRWWCVVVNPQRRKSGDFFHMLLSSHCSCEFVLCVCVWHRQHKRFSMKHKIPWQTKDYKRLLLIGVSAFEWLMNKREQLLLSLGSFILIVLVYHAIAFPSPVVVACCDAKFMMWVESGWGGVYGVCVRVHSFVEWRKVANAALCVGLSMKNKHAKGKNPKLKSRSMTRWRRDISPSFEIYIRRHMAKKQTAQAIWIMI